MKNTRLNASEASDRWNRIMDNGVFQMTPEERMIANHAIDVKEWSQNHPGEVWVLEEIDAWFWVTNHAGINPIKRFRNRDKAIKWLDKQGADWLFKSDYDALIKAKRLRISEE